jgi:hypothetical protein
MGFPGEASGGHQPEGESEGKSPSENRQAGGLVATDGMKPRW